MSGSNADEQVQGALAEVWTRMHQAILERVEVVERGALELANESPDVKCVEAGRGEAHKLAGVLGSFGLNRGTELARELEGRLAAMRGGAADSIRLAGELRQIVENGRA
jgi:HPt (histidine-containing phosphotransfer) domain-containing protein